MLAYNLEDSIIDIYSTEETGTDDDDDDDDDNKYYLDDVDVEEVISYADSIQSDENSFDVSNLIKKLQTIEKTISPLRRENEEMKTKLNNIVEEEIKPLKKENLQLKNENKKMKAQIEKTSKTIDPIMKENQEMKEKLEEIENNFKPLKKENERIKMQLNSIVEDEIEPLKNENLQLKNENKKMKTQIEKAFKSIDPSMKEQFEEIIENRFNELKEENDKMRSQLLKIERKMKEKRFATEISDKDSSVLEEVDYDDKIVDIEKITIKQFNSLSLQSQQNCLLEILSKSKNSKQNQFFASVNAVLAHLLQFVQIKSSSFFEFSCTDDKIKLTEINNNCQVKILSKAIEVLFSNRSLHSPEFAQILQKLNCFSFDLKYPSQYFEPLYNIISTLRKSLVFQINLFITNTNEINSYFQNKDFINSIRVDVSVSTIKPGSFSGCSSLREITIPPSVSLIGERSFYRCKSLKRIIIPCSITEIANGAFEECTSLSDVEIPTSVVSIKSNSFHGCASLTKVNIPSSVKSIEDNAFNGCTSLTEIAIPSSVKAIGKNCFYGIEKLHISGVIQHIPDNSFYGCSTLKEITIPSSVKAIGNSCFGGCTSLRNLTLESVHSRYEINAFTGILSLRSLTYLSVKQSKPDVLSQIPLFEYSNLNSATFNKLDGETQIFYSSMIKIISDNILRKNNNYEQENKNEQIRVIIRLLKIISNQIRHSTTHAQNYITVAKSQNKYSNNETDIFISPEIIEIVCVRNKKKCNFFKIKNSNINIYLTLTYPSDHFQMLYENIVSYNNNNGNGYNRYYICVFIKGIESTDNRFQGDRNIRCVKFDSTVQCISGNKFGGSFENCESLKQVYIPSSVKKIAPNSFSRCDCLQNIYAPSTLSDQLKRLNLSNSVNINYE